MNQLKNQPKLLMLAMGVAMGSAQATEVFQQTDLARGYMVVAENTTTAPVAPATTKPAAPVTDKAKEAKCGAKKTTEGKCGEGKCGGKKSEEGKCGEGKCGAADKTKEGKCGEGKCGGASNKSADAPAEEAKPAETKAE